MLPVTPDVRDSPIDRLLFLPSLLFLAVAIVQHLVNPISSILDFGLCWLPPILLFGSAFGINRSSVAPKQYPRMLGWASLGFAVIGIIIVTLLIMPEINIDSINSIIAGFGIGTLGGLVAGYNEAQARERGRVAERERLAAKHAEKENARLEHLNHLLRHDILNSAMVIEGYADILLDDLSEENAKSVQIIQRQAKSIEELIENVRTYMQAADEDTPLQPKNLSKTLRGEIESVKSSFPDLNVTTEIPDGVTVYADPLLRSVFSNLLRNAVIHNESESPEIAVTVEPAADTVTICIRDNGPGISEEVRQKLTTKPQEGQHGFGLYLVQTLVSRYEGSLEFETAAGEPTGTTAIVTFSQSGTGPEAQSVERADAPSKSTRGAS